MKLFFVRNMYTALFANSILKAKPGEYGIAIIYAPTVVDDYITYQDNIEKILRNNSSWKLFVRLKPDRVNFNDFIFPIKNIKRLIESKRIVSNKLVLFEKILLEHRIDEVFVTHLADIYNEVVLHYISDKLEIKCNAFDELLFDGYFRDIQKKNLNTTIVSNSLKIIKNLFYVLLWPDYFDWVNKYIRIDKISFDIKYSLFPCLYPFNNINSNIKVIPEFENIDIYSESILFTSTLSEDGTITLDEELELIKLIASYLPTDTVIRFHPRDSQEKKNKINELSLFRELDVHVKAAEMLLYSPKLKKISGYLTSTLFVASTLRPELEINSFIGCINNGKINKLALNKIKNDFPTINFHGI